MRHSRRTIMMIIVTMVCAVLSLQAKDFVVVIDAGHGGRDPGCVGRKAREKDITLAVAKHLAQRINDELPETKAVLTRSTDRYLTLQQRADIANDSEGDLFISIHVNSLPLKAAGRSKVHGASVYTLGLHKSKNNLSVAMRENSVIELESDYTTKYRGFDPNSTESYIIFELSQNVHLKQSIDFAALAQHYLVHKAGRADKEVRQAGFWVLWATGMPSVLVELDFMCNPTVESFLNSSSGRIKCANALFDAVKEYRQKQSTKNTTAKSESRR